MEAIKKRHIKPGLEYDALFATAPGKVYTIKQEATLSDTVSFIPKVVRQTLDQTKALAQRLKGKTPYESCERIWHFVYEHIQYKKDAKGYEQIRSPRRTWYDRKTGVDCDCYSVFISSILTNMGIPHTLRITKYRTDSFQHIYPIVPTGRQYITLDCVTDHFNYEVPYSAKKDYPMELQFLDGIPALYRDANDWHLIGTGAGMDELGKIIQRNLAKNKKPGTVNAYKKRLATTGMVQKNPAFIKQLKKQQLVNRNQPAIKKTGFLQRVNNTVIQAGNTIMPLIPPARSSAPPSKKKKKGLLKKVSNVARKAISVVNKVNPTTILLRNGLLAAMKLNIMRVAQRLRWGYLSREQAINANIDMAKFDRLKKVMEKLDKIFYGAGGKPVNLKKAILTGKGNKDKKVALSGIEGLGAVEYMTPASMNVYTPLPQLLGPEVYYAENLEGSEELIALGHTNGLGEPITAASIAAATGAVAAIAASLKQIGNIFKGKGAGAEDFDEATNQAAENNQPVPGTTTIPTAPTPDDTYIENEPAPIVATTVPSPVAKQDTSTVPNNTAAALQPVATHDAEIINTETTNASQTEKAAATAVATKEEDKDPPAGIWDKHKRWLKPVGIGMAVIAVGAIGYSLFKGSQTKNKSSPSGLGGISQKKKNHQRKPRKKKGRLSPLPLL